MFAVCAMHQPMVRKSKLHVKGAFLHANNLRQGMSDKDDKDLQPSESAGKTMRKSSKPAKKRTAKKTSRKRKTIVNTAKYPRHSLERALRIPLAIMQQNAGKACTDQESAEFVGVSYNGPYQSEIGSAKKYGLLSAPATKKIEVTDLAKKILRPQSPGDELEGRRKAITDAVDIADVYHHYRGENIPDAQFFENTLVDKFKIPREKIADFKSIFFDNLKFAQLVEDHNGKQRVLDVSHQPATGSSKSERIRRLGKSVKVGANDTCFVMMPFGEPLGKYYSSVYEPAVKKAGLNPVRADDDIFGTGKIIDQVWKGITEAKVLIAELTSRNPNVFYELGLAHALQKPVVLVSSNEEDVPFDLKHIRVIYYDIYDPFWGEKLIEKVAENILSALNDPEEAIFKKPDTSN